MRLQRMTEGRLSGNHFTRKWNQWVIIDKGWSKYSHKLSYNAKSGVAIGNRSAFTCRCRHTYCSVCAHATKHNTELQQHDCYKNWDSSRMDTVHGSSCHQMLYTMVLWRGLSQKSLMRGKLTVGMLKHCQLQLTVLSRCKALL